MQNPHTVPCARVISSAAALLFATPLAVGGPPICEPDWIPGIGFASPASIMALAVYDDGGGPALFAAGPGGGVTGLLKKWDGAAWSPVPDAPVTNDMRALVVFDDGNGPALFGTGEFIAAGAVTVANVARWDGVEWSALGEGIAGFGLSLAVFDDGNGAALYVGGSFLSAGDVSANRIARWDGASWSALGSGVGGPVNAMAVFDDGSGPALYVGGAFATAGGMPASNVARWDGARWSAVGAGVAQQVRTLAVFDDGGGARLHAAGFISAPGGFPFTVVRWDGVTWSPLASPTGEGFNGTIQAMTVFDDGTGAGEALYVAGDFSLIVAQGPDTPASRIARWDGGLWTPVDEGVSSSAMSLAIFGEDDAPTLVVGGGFTDAGGFISRGVARWRGCAPSSLFGDLNGDGVVDGADVGLLLASWGQPGVSDLDRDGTTDGADLGLLLGAWT